MVVLSAAVLTKAGKVLLARQFVDLTRVRIEGLLSAFPKLLTADSQHTFIETANVRYLYQPVDNLYVVVITTKSSNILEDLQTLHLLAKLVPDVCKSSNEDEVSKKCFDLVFAFDEAVSLGYKESVTIAQIRTFVEMDSHEERIHDLVQKNKMADVKAEAKRKQKEIRQASKDAGKIKGFGGGMGSMSSAGGNSAPPVAAEPYVVERPAATASTSSASSRGDGHVGMKLGKGTAKKDNFLEHLVEEGDIGEDEYKSAIATNTPASAAAAIPVAKQEAVHVQIEERLTALISNDGGLKSLDVVGEFKLTVREAALEKIRVQLAHEDTDLQFKTHPNVNKTAFTNDMVIEPKQADKGFPVGTALGVVKWRLTSKDESLLPLALSCWPSAGANSTVVNVEYELKNQKLDLRNVVVRIPMPRGHTPVVSQVDGSHTFDHKELKLNWSMALIDKDSSTGSLEFTLPFVCEAAALFPIEIMFQATQTFSTLRIASIKLPNSADQVKFSEQRSLTVDKYTVEL